MSLSVGEIGRRFGLSRSALLYYDVDRAAGCDVQLTSPGYAPLIR